MKIIDYKVADLAGSNISTLIKLGWQPFCAPFVKGDIIFQALVKYEEKDDVV